MNLSELSLRRPVLAIVCSILIIIFGLIGYSFLSVREYPAIDPAVINVKTTYVGADPGIIEQQITEPLEKIINGVQGVVNITSTSTQGARDVYKRQVNSYRVCISTTTIVDGKDKHTGLSCCIHRSCCSILPKIIDAGYSGLDGDCFSGTDLYIITKVYLGTLSAFGYF